MICKMCFEDKERSEFYLDSNNRLRRECKVCSQFLSNTAKGKLKEIDLRIKNNKNTKIKIGRKYTITPRTARIRKSNFKGKLKEIYPEFILFESDQGYYESFQKIAFINDYVIREII